MRYFAVLREQRGVEEEKVATAATTVSDLYLELRHRFRFSLPAERVRAAINDDFAPPTAVLRDGDRVVFIPPVAGG